MVYERPYAGADYNLSLCPLQSRLQHIHHGQPYARVDFIPQSGTDFGFGLSIILALRPLESRNLENDILSSLQDCYGAD